MNVAIGHKPQVTVAPQCPKCQSFDTGVNRSKGMELVHEGKRCRAQKQYRVCRKCGERFGVIHIRGDLPAKRRRGVR